MIPAQRTTFAALPVEVVIAQHAELAAHLHRQRDLLAQGAVAKLHQLGRFDERLAAQLDGLDVAGEFAWSVCETALERPSSGAVFTAALCVLRQIPRDERLPPRLDRLIALAAALPGSRRGLVSALGWLEPGELRGLAPHFLGSADAFRRLIFVAACGVHRVDPGLTSARRFEDESPLVRARAWRTAGEIGKRELVSTAAAAITDEDAACQFWAAWAAVLLGDRHVALDFITSIAEAPGPLQAKAFRLAMQASAISRAHAWLSVIGQAPAKLRWLLRGSGLIGDPKYIPWLIGQMTDLKTTRLAGESFSLITGLDLAWLDMEVKPPENFESGPNDDPNDPNVDMDEDDGLPWPDAAKVQAWWHANAHNFQPGTRYFMGQPLNRESCLRVLRDGFQRQRIAAAHYLSLLNPGTPLFEWRAPARRQQRLLAELS